jgi:RHS repeat-associated protein
VADAYLYAAYGQPAGSTGTDANPFRYGGQVGYYTDANADGLVLCQQRWYDPEYGRWLNRDPIAYNGGENVYAYCGGQPVSCTDPSGLDGDPDFDRLNKIARKIENIRRDIAKRVGEMREDDLELPENAPGDDKCPKLSRRGHRRIINDLKRQKGALENELQEGIESLRAKSKASSFDQWLGNMSDGELLTGTLAVAIPSGILLGPEAVGSEVVGGVAEGIAAAGRALTGLTRLIPPAMPSLSRALLR